ncbi:alpha/beta hydrolase-fold protein [Candidatus Neomarinimicrobiota bacterium]
MRYHFKTIVKTTFILLTLFQPIYSQAQETPESIVIGEKLKIHSTILDEDRELWIYKPASYENSTKRYPVLYLLDGQVNFHHATGAIQFLGFNERRMPETIVVALPNTDRNRDLTTPSIADRALYPTNGGADNFLKFINTEVIPYIEHNYQTSPHKTLVGKSLGGFFVIHTLLTQPEAFDDYIAISPSIWWNEGAIVSIADSILGNNQEFKASLFMTMGNEGGSMLGNAWRLSAVFEEKTTASFNWDFMLMEEESHNSITHKGIYLGLEALNSDWRIPNELVENLGIEGVDKHYQKLSKKYGFTIIAPEQMINDLGYLYLRQQKVKEAINVLKYNIKAYPESANVYDSLGDGYKANNQLKLARKNYQKAVELAKANSDPSLGAFQANLEEIEKRINSQ